MTQFKWYSPQFTLSGEKGEERTEGKREGVWGGGVGGGGLQGGGGVEDAHSTAHRRKLLEFSHTCACKRVYPEFVKTWDVVCCSGSLLASHSNLACWPATFREGKGHETNKGRQGDHVLLFARETVVAI